MMISKSMRQNTGDQFSLTLHKFHSAYNSYISPTIIEETPIERCIYGCVFTADDGPDHFSGYTH